MARLIVRRGDPERYDTLYKTFGSRVPVLWDRRRIERRKLSETPPGDERRRADRRAGFPVSWTALGFLVVD